jgi:hypothetical protein
MGRRSRPRYDRRDPHCQKQLTSRSSRNQWVKKNKANLLMLVLTLTFFAVQEYQYYIGESVLESEISASSRVTADISRGGQAYLGQRSDGTYLAAIERPLEDAAHLQACVGVVIVRANGTAEPPITSC